MPWIDADTGRPYTDKELEALKGQAGPAQPAAQPAPRAEPTTAHMTDAAQVEDFPSAVGHLGSQVAGGAEASLKKTYLGLKQLATYVTGDNQARQAVNDEIKRMEEEYGPVLNTPAGKVGEIAGTVGQFMIPGAILGRIAKAAPHVASIASKIFGNAGSIQRAAITAGTFEGAQPVLPGNTSTEDMLVQRGGKAALGAAVGAGTAAIANKIFKPGVPTPNERKVLMSKAEKQGFKVTPAERTNNPEFWKLEKKFGIKPSTIEAMNEVKAGHQDIVDQEVMKALGLPGMPIHKDTIGFAKRKANDLYNSVRSIGPFPHDQSAVTDIATLVDDAPEITAHASRLRKLMPKMDGQRFASELQRIRNEIKDTYKQGGSSTNLREGLESLQKRFEDYGEGAVASLSQAGHAAPDALDKMRMGRQAWAVLHRIKPALNYEKGSLDVRKFLSGEERRHLNVVSPIDKAIEPLREVAETWRGIQPPPNLARTSGTPEGLNALGNGSVFGRLLRATHIGEKINAMMDDQALSRYLTSTGRPSPAARIMTPGQNAFVRRLLPPTAIGAGEAMVD